MQEQILRLSDYFLVQLIESLSDTDPYQKLIAMCKREIDPFYEEEGMTNEERMTSGTIQDDKKLNNLMKDMIDDDRSSQIDDSSSIA